MRQFDHSPIKFHVSSRMALVAATVFSLLAPLGANAQSTPAASAPSAMAMDPSMDMHKSMESMNQDMSAMKMTGNTDHDFAMMMRLHHEGALKMAQVELDKGKDPVMRSTAKKIIAAQKKEIAEFDRWLAKHKP